MFAPPGDGPFPAVVILSEIWGLNDDIRRIASRFADNGYLAFAPDLLRGGTWYRCVWSTLIALRRGRGVSIEDLQRLIAAVGARGDVRAVGVVGFCMGGGYALLLGSTTEARAAGVFYGDVSPGVDWDQMCPVVGGYGHRDRAYRAQHRELMRRLDAAGVERDVVMYPDAGHSFVNDAERRAITTLFQPLMAVGYDEAAAEDSWRRMLAFFARHV